MVAVKAKNKPKGLLDDIGDLSGLLDTPTQPDNGPIMVPISLIKEDPNQPRKDDNPGFSTKSLTELAETIKIRGVKSPISIRVNQADPEQYIINHGARRYRASIIAEKTDIPAFIDNDYHEEDQVIENLQRNELTAREIANFIGRMLASGKKKGEIAKSIGKSGAFISQHVTLLDLPEPIAEIFNSGKTKDVTVINELVTTYKKSPENVEAWCKSSPELTRNSVKLLKEFIINSEEKEAEKIINEESGLQKDPQLKKKEKPPQTDNIKQTKFKKTIVKIIYNDRPGRLVLNLRPSKEGFAWIKCDDDGKEIEASLNKVTLLALMEG